MAENVRFVRINGRIVPIKAKGGAPSNKKKSQSPKQEIARYERTVHESTGKGVMKGANLGFAAGAAYAVGDTLVLERKVRVGDRILSKAERWKTARLRFPNGFSKMANYGLKGAGVGIAVGAAVGAWAGVFKAQKNLQNRFPKKKTGLK